MPVEAGHVYIAPGGRHMEVRRRKGQAIVHLHDRPPESSCRPAVDVLFRSVAEEFGGHALAVILTGMGADGCRGCEQLSSLGARILAQDEKSSVVWGMPGAVSRAGLADEVLPLPQIGTKIQDIIQRHGLLPVRISRAA
jgi:two-component system chemotaxis response regulator CheB